MTHLLPKLWLASKEAPGTHHSATTLKLNRELAEDCSISFESCDMPAKKLLLKRWVYSWALYNVHAALKIYFVNILKHVSQNYEPKFSLHSATTVKVFLKCLDFPRSFSLTTLRQFPVRGHVLVVHVLGPQLSKMYFGCVPKKGERRFIAKLMKDVGSALC